MKTKTELIKENEILRNKVNELNNMLVENYKMQRPMVTVSGTGEWCSACGAWKSYGVPDSHHCTGYKVTC